MNEFALRVQPEELKAQASVFQEIVKDIQKNFDEFQNIGLRTKGYWVGEAGDKARLNAASYQEDMAALLQRLQEHPTELLQIAGLYSEAEADAEDIASSLRTDLII